MPSSSINNDKRPVINKHTKSVPFVCRTWCATGKSGVSAPDKASGDSPYIPN